MGSPRVPKGTAPTERALNREPSWLHPSTVWVGGAGLGPPQGTGRWPRGCSTAGAGGNPPHSILAQKSGPASARPLPKTMLPLHRQASTTRSCLALIQWADMQQCITARRHGTPSWRCIIAPHCSIQVPPCFMQTLQFDKQDQGNLQLPSCLGLVKVKVMSLVLPIFVGNNTAVSGLSMFGATVHKLQHQPYHSIFPS